MAEQNLTGVWRGLFSYPTSRKAADFGATLIGTGNDISGSTGEIWASGARAGESVLAMPSGRRNGQTMVFTEAHEDTAKPNQAAECEGTLTNKCLEIKGRWFISASCGGLFLMIRSFGRPVEAARPVFARA